MPLLDHFSLSLSRSHPGHSFFGTWAAAIARLLNAGVLPAAYYAVPFLDRDGPVEIDVGTLQNPGTTAGADGVGPMPVWTPPAPELAVAVERPGAEDVRVEMLMDDGDPAWRPLWSS